MKVKTVSLLVAIGMALMSFSYMTCDTGACHSKTVSLSMPCHHSRHAVESPVSNEGLRSAFDHSCCRVLPALPTRARQMAPAYGSEPGAWSIASEMPGNFTKPEHVLKITLGDSPPKTLPPSLSCVLLL